MSAFKLTMATVLAHAAGYSNLVSYEGEDPSKLDDWHNLNHRLNRNFRTRTTYTAAAACACGKMRLEDSACTCGLAKVQQYWKRLIRVCNEPHVIIHLTEAEMQKLEPMDYADTVARIAQLRYAGAVPVMQMDSRGFENDFQNEFVGHCPDWFRRLAGFMARWNNAERVMDTELRHTYDITIFKHPIARKYVPITPFLYLQGNYTRSAQ